MDKLKLTNILLEIDLIQKEKFQELQNIGVLEGLSGLALFQFYYSKHINSDVNFDFGVKILESCAKKINEGYSHHTFSNGIAGFGWVIDHLEKNQFIDVESDFLLSNMDDYLISILKSELNFKNYDYLHGAIGIAMYFLNRYSNSKIYKTKYEQIIFSFLERLEDISEYVNSRSIRWLSNLRINTDEKGYNLSLSHGIAGIIGFLAETCKHSHFRIFASKLLYKSVNYLLLYENWEREISIFPNWISCNHGENAPSRLGWCYGDLGIGISLYNSSKVLNDVFLEGKSLKILFNCAQRIDPESHMVIDPGICHGSYGNAQIFRKMYIDTGNEIFNNASKFWLKDGLRRSTHIDGFAGYKKWDGSRGDWVSDLSLLEGVSGIGLVIIDFLSSDKNFWDECLMIN